MKVTEAMTGSFLILSGSMCEKVYSNHLIFGKQTSVSVCVYGEQEVRTHRGYLVCAEGEGGEEGNSCSLVYPWILVVFFFSPGKSLEKLHMVKSY